MTERPKVESVSDHTEVIVDLTKGGEISQGSSNIYIIYITLFLLKFNKVLIYMIFV